MKMGQVEKKMHDTVSGSMRDFHCARNEPKERTQGEGICLLGCSDCTKWPLVTSTRARRQDRGMGGREGYGVFHMPFPHAPFDFDFASLNYVSTGSCLEAMHCGQKWPRAGGVLEHEPTPTSLCMYSVEEHCFHLQFNERHAKDS